MAVPGDLNSRHHASFAEVGSVVVQRVILFDSSGSQIESLATADNQVTIIGHIDGIESLLGTIDSDTSLLAGAVSGSSLQVDIVSDSADLLTNTSFNSAFGTAGSADSQVLSVQGITSMTPLLVDATGQGDVPITASQLDIDDLTSTSDSVTSVNETVSSASLSNVSGSASNVQLLASNASRKGASFFNDSTATLYIKFGTTASASSFTTKLLPNQYYEMPFPVYTGEIDGIWDSANGAVRITEL